MAREAIAMVTSGVTFWRSAAAWCWEVVIVTMTLTDVLPRLVLAGLKLHAA
jgi:hypothetical protein